MKHKNAIILFTKNPELGKVKTRLAKTIGDEKALLIYKKLLNHTQSIVASIEQDKFVFYSDTINENDQWNEDGYYKKLQYNGDLGERMNAAFKEVFNLGYQSICIIGSDCYELNSEIIAEAFHKLENYEAVVGPTFDGGYYLLGMNKLHEQLFQNKAWSTDSVFIDTVSDFNTLHLSWHSLIKLSDIDEEKDLPEHWR
ncbi:TIGR04282 family arsenosugar biosynthesis glycosyltransferase [Flavobacterium sp. SUN052]|uniref:TIGR04282 family arsenosugar biosynthesis glycosyltransferase n=1 Tax=Flavobacterium sp. SUN052 TaxID=3002441 RepID=UPI00237DA482|nr:TIGR04282 family arsenosugar biosynthesis glycosyltransferase [Flavobacterium sp. SUN052]MEC4004370.1 TIGR04282 family arsenosugar biosynthesis glycosyltransferase [Flavobacterium sp. SUN052]